MRTQAFSQLLIVVSLLFSAIASGDQNVALNQPVSVASGGTPNGVLGTLTDGIFLGLGTDWQDGTIWWSGYYNTTLQVTLSAAAKVSGLALEADNNDTYEVSYLGSDSSWHFLWYADHEKSVGTGLAEYSTTLPTPITASAFQVYAFGGDGNYAVSEFQAYGQAVPEPTPCGVFACGIAGLLIRRRRRS